jgi:hypothetical protein
LGNAQDLMIEAIKALQDKATESKREIDVERLYHIAAQLTIAQCNGRERDWMTTDTYVQSVFAQHFTFLVKHSIDLIDHNLVQ